ncbi:NudC domain-containing protein 1, partial [Crenichthys baileyi]
LEVTLQKLSEGPMWPELVLGNRRGQFVMSDEQAALIHERLTHLTSEDLNGNPDGDKPPCNSQELEDCDGFPEDSFSLTHFDEESLRPTQVSLELHKESRETGVSASKNHYTRGPPQKPNYTGGPKTFYLVRPHWVF